MNVLAVSTSTPLHQLWLRTPTFDAGAEQHAGRGEPRALTALLWSLLAQAGLRAEDLDLLACDVGPGSFTGLRQGLATVRALAWALGKPIVAVGSLEALVAEARAGGETGPVAVALPARTGVAYAGWSPAPGQLEQALVPQAESLAFWTPRAAGQTVAYAGLALQTGPWLQALREVAEVTAAPISPHPSARRVLELAIAEPTRAQPALLLSPAYLAATEAEVHRGFTVEAEALAAERR